MKAFFFGYRKGSGHVLIVPGGQSAFHAGFQEEDRTIVHVFKGHVDGGLAPKWSGTKETITFTANWDHASDEYRRVEYRLTEMPQGHYLIHHANGYTYMSWWDRTQGDTRGACNSNFILEGTHDAVKMFDELVVHFPHVVENLRKAEVSLRQVVLP